jgi:hypothetical protein
MDGATRDRATPLRDTRGKFNERCVDGTIDLVEESSRGHETTSSSASSVVLPVHVEVNVTVTLAGWHSG